MFRTATQTYRHALREMRFCAGLWLLAFLWTVGYCYLHGYQHAPEAWVVRVGLAKPPAHDQLQHLLGLPTWVAYGIVAPWLVCSTVTVVFGLFFMPDDDLGHEEEHHHGA